VMETEEVCVDDAHDLIKTLQASRSYLNVVCSRKFNGIQKEIQSQLKRHLSLYEENSGEAH